jgi:DNA-directed RNA polymerase specialized sigma subunit
MITKKQLHYYREYKRALKYYDQRLAEGADPKDLQPTRDRHAQLIACIEHVVAGLQDPTEQMLIRLRYFEGYSWTKVGFAMHYSKSSLQRIHTQALQHIEQSGVEIEEVTP